MARPDSLFAFAHHLLPILVIAGRSPSRCARMFRRRLMIIRTYSSSLPFTMCDGPSPIERNFVMWRRSSRTPGSRFWLREAV